MKPGGLSETFVHPSAGYCRESGSAGSASVGNEPGVLAGRLCNRAVTVADSPARVKTGALLNLGSDELPEDGTGKHWSWPPQSA